MPVREKADRPGTAPEEAKEGTRKRLRPRWQRWLLWSAVRLLLLAGVGAGVGTVQWRTRPPDLMAHAQRIASIANASGYYWTPKGELRLYQYGNKGTASLRWNQATQSATFVEMLPAPKGQMYTNPMDNAMKCVQRTKWAGKQVLIVEASRQQQTTLSGKPPPNPDYTWKIKVMPNLPTSFFAMALSPDGKRVAYTCLVPRKDWRDEISRRLRLRYKAPFRGQGAAILISKVDGSSTEALGMVKDDMPDPKSRYARSGATASLQNVFWCRDGKHVSFEYGDGVYTVPVP